MKKTLYTVLLLAAISIPGWTQAKKAPKLTPEQARLEKLKQDAVAGVEKRAVMGQQINDMLFSFSELGFQEVESFKYLTDLFWVITNRISNLYKFSIWSGVLIYFN